MVEELKNTRLFVGGLFEGVTSEDLKQRFSRFGNVDDVEIKVRKDDDGNHLKTFAYLNVGLTDKSFKQCMQTYNRTKWKGGEVYIQQARESFVDRLSREREQQQQTDEAPVKRDGAPKIPPQLKPGMSATPGTRLEHHKNWVVGKYGRVLPVVNIRRKDKKKIVEMDPSKYCHGMKKLNQEAADGDLTSLTWCLEETTASGRPTASAESSSSNSSDEEEKTKKKAPVKRQSASKLVREKTISSSRNTWSKQGVETSSSSSSDSDVKHKSRKLPEFKGTSSLSPSSLPQKKGNKLEIVAGNGLAGKDYSDSSADTNDILMASKQKGNDSRGVSQTGSTKSKKTKEKSTLKNKQADEVKKSIKTVEATRATSEPTDNLSGSGKEDAMELFRKSIEMLQKAQQLMGQQLGQNMPDLSALLTPAKIVDTTSQTTSKKSGPAVGKNSNSPQVETKVVSQSKKESPLKKARKKKELVKHYMSDSSDSDTPGNVELKKKALKKITAHKALQGGSQTSSEDETDAIKDKERPADQGSSGIQSPNPVQEDGSSDSDHPAQILLRRQKIENIPAKNKASLSDVPVPPQKKQKADKVSDNTAVANLSPAKSLQSKLSKEEPEAPRVTPQKKSSTKAADHDLQIPSPFVNEISSTQVMHPELYHSSSSEEEGEKSLRKMSPCEPMSNNSVLLGSLPSVSMSEFGSGLEASLKRKHHINDSDEGEDLLDIVASGNKAALNKMLHKAEGEIQMKKKQPTKTTYSGTQTIVSPSSTPSLLDDSQSMVSVREKKMKHKHQQSEETVENSPVPGELKSKEKSTKHIVDRKRKNSLNAEDSDISKIEDGKVKKKQKMQNKETVVELSGSTTNKIDSEVKDNKMKKNPTKLDKHEQSNLRRLESLKERKMENASQQRAIKDALSKVDKGQPSSNKVVFASDDEDAGPEADNTGHNLTTVVGGQAKTLEKGPTLFASDSESSDGDHSEADKDIFRIRPEKEGKAGAKLMRLQGRYGNDQRFKLTTAFMDSDASDEQEVEEKDVGAVAEDGAICERDRSLQILQQVVGNKAMLNKTQTKNRFRDVGSLRYDPSQEQHEQFELQQDKPPKKSKPPKNKKSEAPSAGNDEEPEPELEVSKDRFFQVSSDLKSAFQPTTNTGGAFSFSSLFGGGHQNSPSTPGDIPGPAAVPVSTHTSQWQEHFAYDSSSADDDDHMDAMQTQKTPVAGTKKEANTFFFTENDPRIQESIQHFCRQDSLEEIRERWKTQQAAVLESVRMQRKRALRNLHQSQHARPGYSHRGGPVKRGRKH